ncbi:hypothetical protein DL89DRAFT_268974 [Linderina pennispora]|uniref:Uncharacterized protein n=1 Tax=Linderina pennispora TaxID=61395 RepID=A0A1Y1W2I6_9FUNG|nr:uncharacterized protein DL89DRAFT_268974 [Linderina pennispora]ORX67760.1 hypothetical protein DL89DRAFT_268974 [Linderina pennispora]
MESLDHQPRVCEARRWISGIRYLLEMQHCYCTNELEKAGYSGPGTGGSKSKREQESLVISKYGLVFLIFI